MAQLIKLLDFISRYEMNMYRYPSQYIRLKKQHWNKLKVLWEQGILEESFRKEEEPIKVEKKSLFKPLKEMMKRNQSTDNETEELFDTEQEVTDEFEDGNLPLDYSFTNSPSNEEELKRRFLDGLIEFQIRWASSTIREKSYVDRPLYFDETLKYFLQRFPDNYLVLYKPVFLVQKAPIELEIIMVSPTETWCISILEDKEDSVFLGSKDRFWTKKYKDEEKKVLSPLIAVNRMEKVIQPIYQSYDIEMPIRKVILNRTGYIDYPYAPVDTMIVDKRVYDEWFSSLRRLSSPLKHVQLKAAKSLLEHCQTTYVKRPEWDSSDVT
jgi:hypothetical protein